VEVQLKLGRLFEKIPWNILLQTAYVLVYKDRYGSSLNTHTTFWRHLSLPHLYSLLFSSLLELGKLHWRACTLEKNLGMNKMKLFSKVLLSFYQYSHAYKLEYGSCVMILAYELAYSSYVMNLACRTYCLIIHTTYIIRIRAKLRWRIIVPLGLPVSYDCRSVGSESLGNMGSFLIHRSGAQVYGNLQKWRCSTIEGYEAGGDSPVHPL
jgi:hypothetical protein